MDSTSRKQVELQPMRLEEAASVTQGVELIKAFIALPAAARGEVLALAKSLVPKAPADLRAVDVV